MPSYWNVMEFSFSFSTWLVKQEATINLVHISYFQQNQPVSHGNGWKSAVYVLSCIDVYHCSLLLFSIFPMRMGFCPQEQFVQWLLLRCFGWDPFRLHHIFMLLSTPCHVSERHSLWKVEAPYLDALNITCANTGFSASCTFYLVHMLSHWDHAFRCMMCTSV